MRGIYLFVSIYLSVILFIYLVFTCFCFLLLRGHCAHDGLKVVHSSPTCSVYCYLCSELSLRSSRVFPSLKWWDMVVWLSYVALNFCGRILILPYDFIHFISYVNGRTSSVFHTILWHWILPKWCCGMRFTVWLGNNRGFGQTHCYVREDQSYLACSGVKKRKCMHKKRCSTIFLL